MSLSDEIPGFKEALKAESEDRLRACLGLPETICGMECLPLTPRHLITLMGIESPFVCGVRFPTQADVALFLWVLSPKFTTYHGFNYWIHVRRCRKLNTFAAITGIHHFIQIAFDDAPPGSTRDDASPEPVSWFVALVHMFAQEYGWKISDIADMPFTQLNQFRRVFEKKRNPNAIFINRRSSNARQKYLDGLNAAN